MTEEDIIAGLIVDISEGSEDAFRQLYSETNEKVFRYLYRCTNSREISEDLLIDTYAEVWKSAKNFRGKSKVSTWIIGIARNLTMNEFRKNKIKDCDLAEEELFLPPDQHRKSSISETAEILEEALNRLPLKHREILDLVFLQEMRYEEISQVMNIPVNTVKTRVFHAKDKLRDILGHMGISKDDLAYERY
jgi:RNA polymerase sigma-70 factor (ECF subfamily)